MNAGTCTSSHTNQRIHVLHADDEPDFADRTVTLVERGPDGITVQAATTPERGLALPTNDTVDRIVSDRRTGGDHTVSVAAQGPSGAPWVSERTDVPCCVRIGHAVSDSTAAATQRDPSACHVAIDKTMINFREVGTSWIPT